MTTFFGVLCLFLEKKQAQEERLREQELEREERARLDEILQMCAEYQRQIDEERHSKRVAATQRPKSADPHSTTLSLCPVSADETAAVLNTITTSSKPPPSPGHSLHPNRLGSNGLPTRTTFLLTFSPNISTVEAA